MVTQRYIDLTEPTVQAKLLKADNQPKVVNLDNFRSQKEVSSVSTATIGLGKISSVATRDVDISFVRDASLLTGFSGAFPPYGNVPSSFEIETRQQLNQLVQKIEGLSLTSTYDISGPAREDFPITKEAAISSFGENFDADVWAEFFEDVSDFGQGPSYAFDIAIAALNSKRPSVRVAAVRMIGVLQGANYRQVLMELASKESNVVVRQSIDEALGIPAR